MDWNIFSLNIKITTPNVMKSVDTDIRLSLRVVKVFFRIILESPWKV